MKKSYIIRFVLLFVLVLTGTSILEAQSEQVIYSTGFESSEGFTATTSYNNTTVKYQGPDGMQWGILMGTSSTTGPITDSQSMQMRSYTTVSIPGEVFTNFDLSKVTKVTFKAKAYSDATTFLNAYYSTNGGATWSTPTPINVSTTTLDHTYNISATGEFPSVRIKLEHPLVSEAGRLTLDDLVVYGMVSSTPEVAIPSISATGISHSLDTYFNTATVTLATSTAGAQLYYTLDGTEPTSASTLYTAPFAINATTTVKVIGIAPDMNNSSVATKTITIVAPATATIPYTESFNNTLGDWYKYEVAGTKPWYPSVNGAVANGYAGGDVESWLISPLFTSTSQGVQFSFNYASKYVGVPLLVKTSANYQGFGDPTSATWTTVATIAAPEVQDNDYTIKFSGNILVSEAGPVYFALVYDAEATYSDWRITNAEVNVIPSAPTLTITETTVGSFSATVGQSAAQTLTVSGLNLTADIQAAVSGTDAAYFSVSPSALTPVTGAVENATLTITYTPTAAGSHEATLTLTSTGAEPVSRSLTGTATWAPLDAPVAQAATGILATSFNANWAAVDGATEYIVDVYTKSGASSTAADLFFSEYVEGSSNNKVVEIFNGTGATVDLSAYKVVLFSNGAAIENPGNTTQLEGTLANNATYIVYNAGSVEAITSIGNIASTATYFNGDDAFALYKGETLIDVFGTIGEDPGAAWTADGGYTTVDKTLRRKSSVAQGQTANLAGFPTLATEWDLYEKDDFSGLGSHTFSGGSASVTPVTGSPFTVTGATTLEVTGLQAGVNYFYTVKAKNANVTSVASNEVSVVTSFSTGVDNITNSGIFTSEGYVLFEASAGDRVEVYNVMGQKLISTLATDGLNRVMVDANGIIIVKVGNRTAKLIL